MKKNFAVLLAVCIGAVIMVAAVAVAIALVKNEVAGKLSTLEFVVEITKAVAWPMAFILFISMFQESIADIVRKIQRIAFPGGSVEILQVIENTAAANAALDSEQAAHQKPSPLSDNARDKDLSKTTLDGPTPLSGKQSNAAAKTPVPDDVGTSRDAAPVLTFSKPREPYALSDEEKAALNAITLNTYLGSNNPNLVLAAIAKASDILWGVVFPDKPCPSSLPEKWAMLKAAQAISDAEHQSLQALFSSRAKLLHALNGKDQELTEAALRSFRVLAGRMHILLTTRASLLEETRSK